MMIKQIALAAAVLAGAPAAFALTPGQIDSSTARLWLSGASAPTASIYKGVLTLCAGMTYKNNAGAVLTNPGTRDAHLYLESGSAGKLPGGAGNSLAYSCTIQTIDGRAGALEGVKTVVYHSVDGGSFNYVTPHLTIAGEPNPAGYLPGNLKRTPAVETLAATGKCAVAAAESVAIDLSGSSNTVGVYRGCTPEVKVFNAGQALRATVFQDPDRPEGGYSDTEYMINKLNLGIGMDVTDLGSEIAANINQAFGVAVSYPLYAQLQKNDGIIAADGTGACAGVYTAGVCQPNLASQLYTSLANKDSVSGKDGRVFGGVAGSVINLARRVPTSGTQSVSNIRFLNAPCASGVAAGQLSPARAANSTTTVKITEGAGTGDVKTALNTATGAGQFGLGMMSMENVPAPTASADRWAFVKLDGVSPNSDAKQRANAMAGSYPAWVEMVAFTAATAFPEGADLMTAVTASLSNPDHSDLTGLFINPLAGVTGTNVGKATRGGNSCQPAVQ